MCFGGGRRRRSRSSSSSSSSDNSSLSTTTTTTTTNNTPLPVSLPLKPQVSRHALVKLTDAKGVDIGQGVICLRDALGTRRPLWMNPSIGSKDNTLASSSSSSVVDGRLGAVVKKPDGLLTIDLTQGGKAAGRLKLKLRVGNKTSYISDSASHPPPPASTTTTTTTSNVSFKVSKN